ncbi:MAG TPA: substrate-binding domain-containing protein [Planctomycetaceae bacterium]|nr:substrate-binding domain-containing protein [Planctomycetaceae bacterium]
MRIHQRFQRGATALGFGLALAWLAGCAGEVPKPADPDGNGQPQTSSSSGQSGESKAPAGARRILLLTNGISPFWDACRVGVVDAQRELQLGDANLHAELVPNDGKIDGQLAKLRQWATQSDIAGIGISAVVADNAALADELRKLQQQGVKIVTIDSDMDREQYRDVRFAFIGTDNFAAGHELGLCMKQLRPEGGEYVTFVGKTGAQNAIERVQGVAEGAGEKFTSKDNMGDEIQIAQAQQNVRTALTNHPNLNVLVGIWSYNGPAIVDVVREKGIRDQVTVVTFDAEPNAIAYMGQGDIDAMVVQNPYQMGYQGVRLLKALVEDDQATVRVMFPNHGQENGDIYDTGQKVVVPEGSPLRQEMFSGATEFMPLPEFQEWLQDYDLTGS